MLLPMLPKSLFVCCLPSTDGGEVLGTEVESYIVAVFGSSKCRLLRLALDLVLLLMEIPGA